MREGDRILINKGISKRVMIIARTEIPHSREKIFVTKAGGEYTIAEPFLAEWVRVFGS